MDRLLGALAQRITSQRVLGALALAIVLVIAGVRDLLLFIVILVLGTGAMVLDLVLEVLRPSHNQPLAIAFPEEVALAVRVERVDYELHDSENRRKGSGTLAFAKEVGWVCYLPASLDPRDIIRIVVVDGDGGRWGTGPIRPLFNRAVVERVEE